MLKVLIVDDQPAVRTALQILFRVHGLESLTATNPEEALDLVASEDVGAVVQDMNFTQHDTSGDSGVALFRAIRNLDADLPIVLLTAWGSFEIAVQLVAPWVIGFGSGIEGTPRQLQTHWMVSAIDAQFIVWGIVPSDIREVTVYTSEGDPVSVGTVPVGPPEMASAAFAVVLPERGLIEGMSGQLADGTVSLAGTKLDESLTQFRRHSPLNLEWTGFVPVVQH